MFFDDQNIDFHNRQTSSFRPVLRVASIQQFSSSSVPAQTLITSVELLSGTTFKARTKKRAQALESAQRLARQIIAVGC
jgi:hypothetical protein